MTSFTNYVCGWPLLQTMSVDDLFNKLCLWMTTCQLILFVCSGLNKCEHELHMMTPSDGNILTSLAFCERNPPVTGGFPSQRPVTQSFDVFFDVRQNKRRSKQSRYWWFETPWHSLWRHCNGWNFLFHVQFFQRSIHTIVAVLINILNKC